MYAGIFIISESVSRESPGRKGSIVDGRDGARRAGPATGTGEPGRAVRARRCRGHRVCLCACVHMCLAPSFVCVCVCTVCVCVSRVCVSCVEGRRTHSAVTPSPRHRDTRTHTEFSPSVQRWRGSNVFTSHGDTCVGLAPGQVTLAPGQAARAVTTFERRPAHACEWRPPLSLPAGRGGGRPACPGVPSVERRGRAARRAA